MLKIHELIKKVRACKTADEERSIINKESAEIRNMSKDLNNPYKSRNLAKSIYMQMMGYQTTFIHVTCVNLLASNNFTEKRMAYTALSIIMDENSEVLLLSTQSIKKDLSSTIPSFVACALNAIGDVCTVDMCRELAGEVASLMTNSTDSDIKKRAACAASRIIKKCPELIEMFIDKIPYYLEDRIHSSLLTGITFACHLFEADPSCIDRFRPYVPLLMKYERGLLSISYMPELDVNGIIDPFLQAKIIEMLKYLAKGDKTISDELTDLFVSIHSVSESNKATGYALEYELVKTINVIESNSGLKSLSSTILGKFLTNKDGNLKYIALNTLQHVAKNDLPAVQKHKNVILECLKDPDISIQRRALDLIYLIMNTSNIKHITKECLNYLPVAENELKLELTAKITQSIDKYSPSFKWQIDTLIKMLCISSTFIYEDTLANIINLIVSVDYLQIYSVHKLFLALKNNIHHECLVKVAIYAIGEFGHLLVGNSILGPEDEVISVSEDDVLAVLKSVEIFKKYSSTAVHEYLMNCYVKLSTKFSSMKCGEIMKSFEEQKSSCHPEVQQRAVEYYTFQRILSDDMKKNVTKNIPVIPVKNAAAKEIMIDEFDQEEEVNSLTLKVGSIARKKSAFKIPDNISGLINAIDFSEKQPEQMPSSVGGGNITGVNLIDLGNLFSKISQNEKDTSGGGTSLLPSGISVNSLIQTKVDSALGIFPDNMSYPQQETTLKTGSTQIVDLLSISSPVSSNMNTREVLRNQQIAMSYAITSNPDGSYSGTFYVSNLSPIPLTNVKLNFLVLKYLSLKVLATSGTQLEPMQVNGIKKDFVISSSDPDKKITVKVKYAYHYENTEIVDTITIDNLK